MTHETAQHPAAEAAARRLRLKPRARPSLQRQSFGRAATLVASLAALAVRPGVAQCPDGTPPPCGATVRRAAPRRAPPDAAQRRRSFLVLPFRNVSRSPEHDWLVEGSPVLIADALSRNDAVTVVPDERLYPALQRSGLSPGGVMDLTRVRRVATETGGWTAVTGEILVLGDRLRVSARAFDVVSNTEVLRVVEEASPGEDVRVVYQRLGTRLMRTAGVGTAAAADLATTTTASVDAYRAYVRGLAHLNRSEARRARDAFREAVGIDSGFAQAYARLAQAELSVNPAQINNLQSPLYRSAARAAALAGNLPTRDRELVLAISDFFSARLASARERLERLLAQDSTNVDALEWLATLETLDFILVTRRSGERPRGSLSAGLRFAKRALELDASRHRLYSLLVETYVRVGGGALGFVVGFRREASSLPAMLGGVPDRVFIPMLRDTVELVPIDSLNIIPADSLAAARRRAIDAGRQWSHRWLAAGPGESDAHLWASRVHALAGDYDRALRSLNTADSLGVETGQENVPTRRMSLLARLGRYAEGMQIADSLWNARALDVSALTPYQVEGVSWAFLLFILARRYDVPAALHEGTSLALAPVALMNPQMTADAHATRVLGGSFRATFIAPADIRRRVAVQLLDDAAGLPGGPLARMLPYYVSILLPDTAIPDRSGLARHAAASAARIATTHPDLAYQLAIVAREDSSARRAVDSLSWYATRSGAYEAEKLAALRRVRPLRASVTDSAATFSWSVTGDTFRWNHVETEPGDANFNFQVEFEAAGTRYRPAVMIGGRPGAVPASGRLSDLLNASVRLMREVVGADTNAPTRQLLRIPLRVEPEPGGFRMVIRDAGIVAALRRQRPATVRMRFLPCARPEGAARQECVDEQVPVTYP